jgi:hypothetical protein
MRCFSFLLLLPMAQAFMVNQTPQSHSIASSTRLAETTESFEISIDMPPSNSGLQANMKIVSILSVPSEIVEVRYKLPFGLDVAPKKGLAVCMKDGKGGEKVGDVSEVSFLLGPVSPPNNHYSCLVSLFAVVFILFCTVGVAILVPMDHGLAKG